jgi:hypothetical protein
MNHNKWTLVIFSFLIISFSKQNCYQISFFSHKTIDFKNSAIQQMNEEDTEQFQRQIEELTKQLNESI